MSSRSRPADLGIAMTWSTIGQHRSRRSAGATDASSRTVVTVAYLNFVRPSFTAAGSSAMHAGGGIEGGALVSSTRLPDSKTACAPRSPSSWQSPRKHRSGGRIPPQSPHQTAGHLLAPWRRANAALLVCDVVGDDDRVIEHERAGQLV